MKKKRNLIGVCLVAVLMLALTVIGYAAGDGEAAPEYGAWCLVPPLVTIVLAFVTKQTIISMFIGIWVGATIIHHFNPIDGLIGSFTGYLVPSIADSWNAGMLIIMALIGGFMYMLSACGGAEAFGRWAEKLAIETGKTYSDTDNLIATPPETDFAEDCKLSMANFLAPMITLILTIFAVVFYTGQIWVNGFIGCFGHANIQMAIAMCFLTGSIAAGIVGIKSKLITLGGAIDKWTKGAASMMQVIMILVCAWSISGLTKSMNIGQFLTGVVQDSIPAALIPAILFLIGVVVSFATGSSWGVWALGMPIALPMANAMGIPLTLAIGAVVSGGLFGDHCSPISDTTIQSSTSACCDHLQHVKTQMPYALTVGISSLIGFLFAGLVAPVLALPVTLVCIIAALLVMKNISRKQAAVAA